MPPRASKPKQRADGRFPLKITLPNGKVKTVYGKTAAEAKRKIREIEGAVARNEVSFTEQTFTDYLDKWLAHQDDLDLKPNTLRNYESRVRLYIRPHLGRCKLRDLTSEHIDDFLKLLLTLRWKGRPLSDRTRFGIYTVLVAALHQAVIWKRIPVNPCFFSDKRLRPRLTNDTSEEKGLTEEEARRFVLALSESPDRAFLATYLYTGARRGEVLGIRVPDVDLDAGEIQISGNVQVVKKKGERGTHERLKPKTPSSEHAVYIPPLLVEYLREHLEQREKMKAAAVKGSWDSTEYLFCRKDGSSLRIGTVQRKMTQFLRALGIEDGGFHRLRHAYGSLLFHAGVDIITIQTSMGHSKPSITSDIYIHKDVRKNKQAPVILEELLKRDGVKDGVRHNENGVK